MGTTGTQTFQGCQSLTSLTISKGPDQPSPGGHACQITSLLLNAVTILGNVKCIASELFIGNSSMASLVILDGVATIGAAAFQGCASLKSLVLPASIKSIHSKAFEDCGALDFLTFPEELPVE